MENVLICMTVAVTVILFLARFGKTKPAGETDQTAHMYIPGITPRGMTMAGDHLFIMDADSGKLYKWDKEMQVETETLDTGFTDPRGLTWDGTHLWCVDTDTHTVAQLNPANQRMLLKFNAPGCENIEQAALEDIAWDETNQCLWMAYASEAGTELFRVDPQNGEIMQSVLLNSHTRGITADGPFLWTTSYNLNNYGGAVSRLLISDDADTMSASRVSLRNTPAKMPGAISFDHNGFRLIDREEGTLVRQDIPQTWRSIDETIAPPPEPKRRRTTTVTAVRPMTAS